MKFSHAVAGDKITVKGTVSTTSSAFNVLGPLAKFVISVPATATVGSPATITITAEDTAGNRLESYAGTPTWADTSKQLSGSPAAFVNGASSNTVSFKSAFVGDHVTVTDSAHSVSSMSTVFNIRGPLAKYVIAVPASATVGKPATITITAEDAAGNRVPGGTPTWADTSKQLSGSPSTFVDGVSSNSVTFKSPFSGDRVTVTNTAQSVNSTSASFNIVS